MRATIPVTDIRAGDVLTDGRIVQSVEPLHSHVIVTLSDKSSSTYPVGWEADIII